MYTTLIITLEIDLMSAPMYFSHNSFQMYITVLSKLRCSYNVKILGQIFKCLFTLLKFVQMMPRLVFDKLEPSFKFNA